MPPRLILLVPASLLSVIPVFAPPATANGWGEQAAPSFRYSNQGITNEIYRVQLGASAVASAAAAAAASRGSAGGGLSSAQTSDQLNNVVQINNNATYNVQVSGNDNYLNFDTKVDAQQSSQDSSFESSNTGTSYRAAPSRPQSRDLFLNR